jgi:geranylgeranyl pyrophosphate synthase
MLDDLLDFTSSEAALGKPVGNDLREHKMTLPLIFALEAPTAGFRDALERFYGGDPGEEGSAAGVERLVSGVERAGGLAKTREAIAGYVERAKMSLAPLGLVPARAELAALADGLARDSAAHAR